MWLIALTGKCQLVSASDRQFFSHKWNPKSLVPRYQNWTVKEQSDQRFADDSGLFYPKSFVTFFLLSPILDKVNICKSSFFLKWQDWEMGVCQLFLYYNFSQICLSFVKHINSRFWMLFSVLTRQSSSRKWRTAHCPPPPPRPPLRLLKTIWKKKIRNIFRKLFRGRGTPICKGVPQPPPGFLVGGAGQLAPTPQPGPWVRGHPHPHPPTHTCTFG